MCLAVGVAAMLFGVGRVDQLDRRTLRAGPFSGVVTVVTQPGAGRGLAAVDGARETGVPGAEGLAEQGGVYRVSGHLQPIDAVVAGYYATQGAHLDLRAESVREIGRRRGLWGVVDAAHRRALAVLESGGGTPASRD